jgi:hypothetical protein
MVEYHGWITLREDSGRLNAIAATIQEELGQSSRQIRGMKLVNSTYLIWLAGCKERWSSDVDEALDLFRTVGSLAPASYGLLYVWNDEGEQDNAFRVWRLAKGALTQHADPFLSPCNPTILDASGILGKT